VGGGSHRGHQGLPPFPLTDKEKQGEGRYKKIDEKRPKTPYQGLLESRLVSEGSKAEQKRRKSAYNPEVLNSRLNQTIERLLKINGEKDKVKPASGPGADQAKAV
jgi:hypothetical protein